MAQTYTNIFADVASFEALYDAWQRVKRGRRLQSDVLAFERDLEPNLIAIQNSLLDRSYVTGPYHRFKVFEPKERNVASLPLKDRIVQHALVGAIGPIWERRFIHDSYACRTGKGMHAGADRAQAFLRRCLREHGRVFALKADISKYFPSISHDALRRIVRRRIADRDLLWLIDSIIASTEEPGDPLPRGIPIGNLTSQLFANIYLHELDEFVKYDLREPLYVRYMDDFVVVSPDKAHLHEVRRTIEDFLFARLALRFNPKTQVFPVAVENGRALDFLGYQIWPSHRRLRKDSIGRMKRKMKRMARLYHEDKLTMTEIERVLASWIGHASHADTFNLRQRVIGDVIFRPPPRARR